MQATLPESWRSLPRGLRDAVLEKLLKRHKQQSSSTALRLLKADLSEPIPASLEQQYFLGQQEKHAYQLAWTIAARPIILESVDEDKVREALQKMMQRHDVLHSTIVKQDVRFELKPDSTAELPFVITDVPLVAMLTGAEKWVKRHYQKMLGKPFDPTNGPLWRAELVTSGERGVLLLCYCSLIVDGESMAMLDHELRQLLEETVEQNNAPTAFSYADYAHTQATLQQRGHFDKALEWWGKRLAGGPPSGWVDGRLPAAEAQLYEQVISAEFGEKLDAYAASHSTTASVVLLTEYMAVLQQLDSSNDLWVSMAAATRDIMGAETIVGTFARQVLLRFEWPTAGEALPLVHKMLGESVDQDPVPNVLLQELLQKDTPQSPSPFRYIFNYRVVGTKTDPKVKEVVFRSGGKHANGIREEHVLFMIMQSGQNRELHWYLRTDRFSSSDAEKLLKAFHENLKKRIEL